MIRSTALLGVAFALAACRDAVEPLGVAPRLAAAVSAASAAPASGIMLDQQNGAMDVQTPWGTNGTHIGKGFDPTNPHLGDAIVVTFFWFGSSNTITMVTDHLSDAAQTPVGNTYTLVDYETAGGLSMATYVATNVQGFPDPATNPGQILCVHAIFSVPVTGGLQMTAYSGVNAVSAWALGAHRSAAGSGSTITSAGPGAIAIGTGALAHAVTMTNGLVGFDQPRGFTDIGVGSDTSMVEDAEYAVSDSVGSVDPQWTWYFGFPSTWLATVFALNPPLHLVFTGQPRTTLPLMNITPAVQVSATDASGNVVPSFSGAVTIAIGHNGGTLMPGTLSGTKTVTAVNGVATFSDLSIDQLGNGYTLVVTAAGVTGGESTPFNIGAF